MTMKKPPTLLYLLGLVLSMPAFGYLSAISATPFTLFDGQGAPWAAMLASAAFWLGMLLLILNFFFPKPLKAMTPLQWLGVGVLVGLLSSGAFLLVPHSPGRGWGLLLPACMVIGISLQAVGMRNQSHSWNKAPLY